eukprot:TRINITY_DN11181_c0_g1_i5.p1 TRINITY_DN11181_c0_g1~~TRINITY_DN11181_c0_g1_i5.p1  ORF type:complete len:463 (-),score=43.74 TRINITY_DN11181_c0_g1_i5:119-1507(-)
MVVFALEPQVSPFMANDATELKPPEMKPFWFVFCVTAPILALERLLRLSCTEVSTLALVSAMSAVVAALTAGWLLSHGARSLFIWIPTVSFGIGNGIAVAISVVAGVPSPAMVCPFLVVWFALMMKIAMGRKFLAGAFFAVTLTQGMFDLYILSAVRIQNILPGRLASLVVPMFAWLFHLVAFNAVRFAYTCCNGRESPLCVETICAYVTQTAEGLRLAGYLSMVLAEDRENLYINAVLSSMLGVVVDFLTRNLVLQQLFSKVFGVSYEVTRLKDLDLRCRFTFSYTPILICFASVPVMVLTRWGAADRFEMCTLAAIALASEVASDIVVVVSQHLHGESLTATYMRLHVHGGHVAFGWHYQNDVENRGGGRTTHTPVEMIIIPNVTLGRTDDLESSGSTPSPESNSDTSALADSRCGSRKQLALVMSNLFVVLHCWRNFDNAVAGLFGGCGWNVASSLCRA